MERLITFQQILAEAIPAVLRLNWQKYGSNWGYSFFDNDGLPIRTGILHGFMGAKQTYLGCCRVTGVGQLADAGKSFRMLVRKCQLVQMNGSLTSLPHRNPEKGDWGGGIYIGGYEIEDTDEGIRSNTVGDDPLVSCVTSLPDIADHLLNAHTLREAGILNYYDAKPLLDPSLPGMEEAREWAKMSLQQFFMLSKKIGAQVEIGRRVVRA